jgi:hypothetical protein
VAARQRTVSFYDHEGIRHSVQVPAESLDEAAVLAMRAFGEHDCAPGPASKLEVEVAAPIVIHTLTVKKLREWLNGACLDPSEKLAKERLEGYSGLGLVAPKTGRLHSRRVQRQLGGRPARTQPGLCSRSEEMTLRPGWERWRIALLG